MENLIIIMLVAVTLWQQIKIHRLKKKDRAQQWELMVLNMQNAHNSAEAHNWFGEAFRNKMDLLKIKNQLNQP